MFAVELIQKKTQQYTGIIIDYRTTCGGRTHNIIKVTCIWRRLLPLLKSEIILINLLISKDWERIQCYVIQIRQGVFRMILVRRVCCLSFNSRKQITITKVIQQLTPLMITTHTTDIKQKRVEYLTIIGKIYKPIIFIIVLTKINKEVDEVLQRKPRMLIYLSRIEDGKSVSRITSLCDERRELIPQQTKRDKVKIVVLTQTSKGSRIKRLCSHE